MQQRYNIAIMHLVSGIHLGNGIGAEYDRSDSVIHSDTLSGALCSVYAANGGEDVKAFMDSFSISSAMPIYDGRLFMPLPPDKQRIKIRGNESAYKRLKALRWIERELWENFAQKGKLEISEQMISDCGSAAVCGLGAGITILKHTLEQKVQVVFGEDANPFFLDKVYLGSKVSLAVLYKTNNEEQFRDVFNMLSYSGIGTYKSTGNGSFTLEFGEVEINSADDCSSSQLLSMWIPDKGECSSEVMSKSCYKIVTRGGYMAGSVEPSDRHLIKKSVKMIESGACIAATDIKGSIVDLNNIECHHPIWRDGRAFCLPFKFDAYGV